MKVFAVNGSPRKNGNTAILLQEYLRGASSADEKLEMHLISLYDYAFTGCRECYACKLKDGKSYGICAAKDDITELLQEASYADSIVFGSPIFFAGVTGKLRCFLERLLFPYNVYTKDAAKRSIAPKKIKTAFLYTMNATEQVAVSNNYPECLSPLHKSAERVFGCKPEVHCAYFTYQFDDYSKYVGDLWDIQEKKEWHETEFVHDMQCAYEMGKRLASLFLSY